MQAWLQKGQNSSWLYRNVGGGHRLPQAQDRLQFGVESNQRNGGDECRRDCTRNRDHQQASSEFVRKFRLRPGQAHVQILFERCGCIETQVVVEIKVFALTCFVEPKLFLSFCLRFFFVLIGM